jgi:hypothetical protein
MQYSPLLLLSSNSHAMCLVEYALPNCFKIQSHSPWQFSPYIYIYIYIYMLKFHIIYIWCCLYRQIQRTLLFYIRGKILCLSSRRPINNTENAQIRVLWLLIWWPLEIYMVVIFRARGISRGTRKLVRTPTLN